MAGKKKRTKWNKVGSQRRILCINQIVKTRINFPSSCKYLHFSSTRKSLCMAIPFHNVTIYVCSAVSHVFQAQ